MKIPVHTQAVRQLSRSAKSCGHLLEGTPMAGGNPKLVHVQANGASGTLPRALVLRITTFWAISALVAPDGDSVLPNRTQSTLCSSGPTLGVGKPPRSAASTSPRPRCVRVETRRTWQAIRQRGSEEGCLPWLALNASLRSVDYPNPKSGLAIKNLNALRTVEAVDLLLRALGEPGRQTLLQVLAGGVRHRLGLRNSGLLLLDGGHVCHNRVQFLPGHLEKLGELEGQGLSSQGGHIGELGENGGLPLARQHYCWVSAFVRGVAPRAPRGEIQLLTAEKH
mmetsp:Transcript_66506/g.152367  ORF Transcript_66506/g.152367 Transcript_66506/m.152367 type:complete len:280 (-) Transcript_66506:40-879(-)